MVSKGERNPNFLIQRRKKKILTLRIREKNTEESMILLRVTMPVIILKKRNNQLGK